MDTAPGLSLAQQWAMLPSKRFKKRRKTNTVTQDHSKLEEIPESLLDIRSSMMKTRFGSAVVGAALH